MLNFEAVAGVKILIWNYSSLNVEYKNIGGYTPNDVFELFLGKDNIIKVGYTDGGRAKRKKGLIRARGVKSLVNSYLHRSLWLRDHGKSLVCRQ